MYVRVHVHVCCMYVCMCVCVCLCVCMYVCTCMCMLIYTQTCTMNICTCDCYVSIKASCVNILYFIIRISNYKGESEGSCIYWQNRRYADMCLYNYMYYYICHYMSCKLMFCYCATGIYTYTCIIICIHIYMKYWWRS